MVELEREEGQELQELKRQAWRYLFLYNHFFFEMWQTQNMLQACDTGVSGDQVRWCTLALYQRLCMTMCDTRVSGEHATQGCRVALSETGVKGVPVHVAHAHKVTNTMWS